MKGLSILLTLALLVLAHQLSVYLKKSGSPQATSDPEVGPLMQHSDIQLQARTNARGVVPRHIPAFRAEGKFRGYSQDPYPEAPSASIEL